MKKKKTKKKKVHKTAKKGTFIDHRGQQQECEKNSFFDGVSFEYLGSE